MVLMEVIQKKLTEKQTKQKVSTLLPILQRLSDERYRPSPDDRIINTELSDFKTVAEKRAAYNKGLDNQDIVLLPGGGTTLLGSEGAKFNDVDFLGGLWRVQQPFDSRGYPVITIYDNKNKKDLRFVLLQKLDRQEHTNFVYYNAASVIWGAHGLSCSFEPTYIIAKYATNRGLFYSYRCKLTDSNALENARAHLAGNVLAAYQDVIEAEIQSHRLNYRE